MYERLSCYLDSDHCRKGVCSVTRVVLRASDPARERPGHSPDHINQIKLDNRHVNLERASAIVQCKKRTLHRAPTWVCASRHSPQRLH